MMSKSSATQELRHLLTIPVASSSSAGPLDPHHNNPVAVAHAALEAIRDGGDEHFLFLRCILELCSSASIRPPGTTQQQQDEEELLLFHCITGCRQVVLWQWNQYARPFVHGLRDYFTVLGNHQSMSRTCRLACYTTSVAFWKRSWNEEGDSNHHNNIIHSTPVSPPEQALLSSIAASVQLPGLNTMYDLFGYLEVLFQRDLQQGSLFLDCLVGEFCGKSAVSYRLPLEFHNMAHRSFERKGALTHSLKLTVSSLSRVIGAIIENPATINVDQALAVVHVTTNVISWEFGTSAWDADHHVGSTALASSRTLIRAPVEWKEYFVRTDLVEAVFRVQAIVAQQHTQEKHVALAHSLRQLLVQLASFSGPVFSLLEDRKQYASLFCERTLKLLQSSSALQVKEETSDLLDTFQLISRIIANFRLSMLTELPTFVPLLQGLIAVGNKLLEDHVRECEGAKGDVESMENKYWREEALALLLECVVLLCGDPWILYSGTEQSRKNAQLSLSSILGPLFEGFVRCRTRMAALEEHFLVSNETEFDEVRDSIMETSLAEEMESVATIGRLHLSAALSCLSSLFGRTMPQLQGLWESPDGNVTTEASALLEEARLLTMYVSHLLTDSNEGESPSIPDAVLVSCREHEMLVGDLSAAVQALLQFANSQVQSIAMDPTNRRLSPLLAQSFLWFLNRWVPAYMYPTDYGESNASTRLVHEWSTPDSANQVVNFCLNLCLHYLCCWPQEKAVQESVTKLLLSLAKRGDRSRALMVASPIFHDMVRFHCLTAGLRHSAPQSEFETAMRAKVGDSPPPSMNMIWGYHRLPYQNKAHVLTAILVACSDTSDEVANSMINGALIAVHEAFTSLVNALASKQIKSEDVHAREMACLCVEMFCGVVQASEMSKPERIPQFISLYLLQLSGLMAYYAEDLTVCETLLRFFQDYTTHFIALLDRAQSLVLFQASAELLKSYSANHIASRAIRKKSTMEVEAEEEQAYNDILCATHLLINLGTKDFIDLCAKEGVESSQVTDMIFFGLKQILPLMTAGLLQFPTLCSVFFDLIAFMMDTYPEKVCVLPYDLFDSLLESLLFGMSHLDPNIAKSSLQGLASIAREHINTGVLKPHLQHHPDIFDRCSRRLLSEVVFQTVVVDRVEAAGMALLPLAAVDVNRFAVVVQELSLRVSNPQHRVRLEAAFSKLIKPEAVVKVSAGGYEGRVNRVKFKGDFEDFVNEVHAFLVLR